MPFLSSFFKKPAPAPDERAHTLAYIESHAPKDEFTQWLMQDFGLTFPPEADWNEIKDNLSLNQKVSTEALKNYAAQLEPDKDTTEVLEEVVAETKRAQNIAQELRFLTSSKTLAIALGGAIVLLGLLLLLTAAALLLNILPFELSNQWRTFFGLLSGLIGLLQLLGGLLLITR